MTRVVKKISLKQPDTISRQLLQWAQNQTTFAWFDSNNYSQRYSSFEKALAVGVKTKLESNYKNAFQKLDEYQQQTNDYIFGYLTYDLKNDTENLVSENADFLSFPDLFFFQALKVFFIRDNFLELHYDSLCKNELDSDLNNILNTKTTSIAKKNLINIKQRISKGEYLKKLKKIHKHIISGDSYELNFCMEYYAEAKIDPFEIFKALNKISAPPFSTFFRHQSHYIISASPERFVRKEGKKIISQPIKGTIKRSDNLSEDLSLKEQLRNNPKERSENIMIVDLVRNDLSKTAEKNSVRVEELCQVYTFKQVHQLISTISSTVKEQVSPVSIIKSLYPMGSMTGAPKISSMKIIEEQEISKRGVYSGSVGYFTPNDDFDFNVIIRSILYNDSTKYVSFSVGGAITAKSNPEDEYQECLLKAAAMKKVLT